MATITIPTLFIHDGGEIACPAHAGAYAAAELRRSPGSRLIQTPLGTWEKLSAADLEDLAAMGVTAACETCAARSRANLGGC
ncbi:MAG: hypothetical protein IH621_08950 [Krumholzibacteria bacterium]|nr:hypothetical protein [Candidatus Krumholzibacteria bacterium]